MPKKTKRDEARLLQRPKRAKLSPIESIKRMEDFPKREEAFIAAVRKGIVPRKGWEEAFREMATNGDDFLLLPDVPTVWEREKWEWQ